MQGPSPARLQPRRVRGVGRASVEGGLCHLQGDVLHKEPFSAPGGHLCHSRRDAAAQPSCALLPESVTPASLVLFPARSSVTGLRCGGEGWFLGPWRLCSEAAPSRSPAATESTWCSTHACSVTPWPRKLLVLARAQQGPGQGCLRRGFAEEAWGAAACAGRGRQEGARHRS